MDNNELAAGQPASPLTPRPPSNLPADLHKPLPSHTGPDPSASPGPAFQASHPHWSHLLFPSHWRLLSHESAGAGPFTTKLVHQTPSGRRVHWESRRHRKRLTQRVDSPTAQPAHAAAAQPTAHQQPLPSPDSLCRRLFPYKPDHVAWWTAVLFDVGSLCFVFSSVCEFVPAVYDSEHLNTAYVGWVAFAGSMCFTVGSVLQLGEVVSSPIVAMYHEMTAAQWKHGLDKAYKGRPHQPLLDTQQQQSQQPDSDTDHASNNNNGRTADGPSHPSASRANLSSLLFRLDFYVALIQLFGAISFSINTFAFSGSFELTEPQITGLVYFCDIFASCCFTVSGYLAIMEVTHSYLPFKPLPVARSLYSVEWHLTWYNFLGGIGFLLNGILLVYYPNAGQLPPAYPLLIGSLFFQIGSHLQYIEQADTHGAEQQQPQPQPQQHEQQQRGVDGDGHRKGHSSGQTMEAQQQQSTEEGRLEHGDGGGGGAEDGRGNLNVNGQHINGTH